MLVEEKTVKNYLLDKESFFWTPDYLDISAWIEHIPFAFWLIEVLKPKITVELGVHNGTSYFSFCQAVKRLNIDATCYGVDTWKGDEHSGFYEEEVFGKVIDHNRQEYSRFSTLIRSTFDEAKDYFIDRSIDLLHIDGLHTYEAVKHDFETWFPKLTADALVVFHDINVRDRNFGVFKLWEELKQQYRHFQFDFGHGLGVLAIGEFAQEIEILLNTNKVDEYYIFLRNLFSDRGSSFKNKFDTSLLIKRERENLEMQIKTLSQVTDRHRILESNNTQLQEGNKELTVNNEQLKESHKTLESNNTQLQESCMKLIESNEKLKEKYQASVSEFSEKLNVAKSSFNKITKELSDQKNTIEELNTLIQKQAQIIRWYKDTYEDRNIVGVLKEKIRSRLKKKLNPGKEVLHSSKVIAVNNTKGQEQAIVLNNSLNGKYKKSRYYLKPAKDITFLPDSDEYTSIGSDPFFIVDFKNKGLSAGWYWLSIDIVEVKGRLLLPKLYYDCGRGFNEEDVWNLPDICNGKMESLIKFPFNISTLRFDPTTTECTFTVREFHLKSIGKIKAFQIGISKYKKIHWPQRSYLSLYTGLITDFLKTGKLELKKKIWDSITYKEENSLDKYKAWCALYDTVSPGQMEIIKSLSDNLTYQTFFSIIMPVYNAPVYFLKLAIESVKKQAYKNWELCIADDKSTNEDVKELLIAYQEKDPRIKVVFRETNGHISNASNSALELATGDFMVLLDQDDELPVHCLYMVAAAINKNKNLCIIYSDEDKIDENGNRFDPYFKTDWNKDLFYGQNMISHLGVYKLSLIKKIGGFRPGYEGSQDYDLALRCIEHLEPGQIHHIPHVLYHWRAIEGSTSVDMSNKNYAFDAGLKALKDHLKRTGQAAIGEQNVYNSYRVKWNLPEQEPMVSIIIPTKDEVDVLSACVTSVIQKTRYKNFEVLVIDNNSEEPSTLEYLKRVQNEYKQVKVYTYNSEFNFSAIVNYGVRKSKGEVVLLLNNDTEVINEDWLCEMVSQSMREEIGAVGAKLFYPNGQIQHAGVFLYEGHPGNHIYLKREKTDPGYFNKLNLVQNYSAVTAACLAVRKQLYLEVGGFDENNLKIVYNDVDFCLKIRELGYKNLYTPFAQLVHYESLSRGNDLNEVNFHRFKKEHSYMLTKWKDTVFRDPFFNPNLDPVFNPAIDVRSVQFAFPPNVMYKWQNEIVSEQEKNDVQQVYE